MTFVSKPTDTSLAGIKASIDKQLLKADLVTLTRGQVEALLAALPKEGAGIIHGSPGYEGD